MKQVAASLLSFSAIVSVPAIGANRAEEPPAWAYPVNPPNLKPPADDGVPRRVPGSTITYTLTQIRDRFNTPDWHPDDHPPMPDVVAQGRKPDLFACGHCHRSQGYGGPESGNLAGLPASYILQQVADYKSGARTTSVPKRSVEGMILVSKAVTDEEVRIAAEYFSAIKPRPVVKVVESETTPKTHVVDWHLAADASGATEPLGQRIIEVPENTEQFSDHDSRARFIAYVPVGSVQKGQELAAGGGGMTRQCAACHGIALRGLGPTPVLAGRSPTYVFRQLYDFRSGARAGASSAIMQGVVQKLSVEDMIALSAYVSSLVP